MATFIWPRWLTEKQTLTAGSLEDLRTQLKALQTQQPSTNISEPWTSSKPQKTKTGYRVVAKRLVWKDPPDLDSLTVSIAAKYGNPYIQAQAAQYKAEQGRDA